MVSIPSFIVVGAQKSGTTSLYNYLKVHPEIFLPAQKELEFFSKDALYNKGMAFYRDTWFSDLRGKATVGEVSPQYTMFDAVPERIKSHLPEVKLLFILRNPIDRAYSHYKMAIRRGLVTKDFSDSVRDLLSRGAVPDKLRDSETDFLLFGEYGRITARFAEYFPKQQMHFASFEELVQSPKETMQNIFRFLGVNSDTVPKNIGRTYHRGGEMRFPRFERWMLEQHLLKQAIKRIVPRTLLSALLFWFDTEINVRKTAQSLIEIEPETQRILLDYYVDDVRRLARVSGREYPWSVFEFGR